MRLLPCACLLACLLLSNGLAAQTYTPKQIRFEGGGDRGELLRLTGLTPGTPLTKAQIEAAMAKLAETGAFTELSYSVTPEALVIKLGEASGTGGQALPVRFANLVWWQPTELKKLLEERVPLFHGELPLTGSLTDRVCEAVVQLLAEKGVKNAKVEAMPTTFAAAEPDAPGEIATGTPVAKKSSDTMGVDAIALTMTRPELLLGKVSLPGAAPPTQAQLDIVTNKLAMQEFQTDITSSAIRNNVGDIEKNAGFLDTAVDAPTFGAPREDMTGYAIDATAAVHPGELFHISVLDLGAKPPLNQADAQTAAGLKVGQTAGEMAMRISFMALQRAYVGHGYLDAQVKLRKSIDHAAHTVGMYFTAEPGELYHLAGVDAKALPQDMQAAFADAFTGKPGMEAGYPLGTEVTRALSVIGASHTVRAGMRTNRAEHTVTVVLLPAQAAAAPPAATP